MMFRIKLNMLYRNKLIVFVGAYLGIFLPLGVIMLVDFPVFKTPQELGFTRISIDIKLAGRSPPYTPI
jgi:hypothetical protein